ncbi:SulP family inorganic anion transporter [Jatrophihabitans sp. DSM 45814]
MTSISGWVRPLRTDRSPRRGGSLLARVVAFLPRRSDYAGLGRSWPRDLMAGVTVGVVALPLALAFGVASGVGAGPGLVTAVIAGTVAAVFGGSNVQVSGPTGAMTVVLVPLVARDGAQVVFPLAVLAGIVIMLAALLRLGRLLAYVPWPLIEGFTVGIAIVIAAQEIPSALGVTKPVGSNAAVAAAVALGRFVQDPHWTVLTVLAITVVMTAALPRLHRALPASLITIVAITAVVQLADLRLARIGSLPHGFPVPALPGFGQAGSLIGPALVVAFLGALESLLSARVADGMSDAPRHNPDRELFGQGLANIACGIGGGMPATGAIARTAVNARAGARTRVAALTHAAVLAAIMYAASRLVARVPLVVLAGVLLVTAYRMIERHNVRSVLRSTPGDALVFVVTAVATVALDLVEAVGLGLGLAVVLALVRLSSSARAVAEPMSAHQPELDDEEEHQLLADHVLVYRLDGPLYFAVVNRFLTDLTAITNVQVVILRMSGLRNLDATGARAVGAVVDDLESRGIIVLLKGLNAESTHVLTSVGAIASLTQQGHLFATMPQAIAHAQLHIRQGATA